VIRGAFLLRLVAQTEQLPGAGCFNCPALASLELDGVHGARKVCGEYVNLYSRRACTELS